MTHQARRTLFTLIALLIALSYPLITLSITLSSPRRPFGSRVQNEISSTFNGQTKLTRVLGGLDLQECVYLINNSTTTAISHYVGRSRTAYSFNEKAETTLRTDITGWQHNYNKNNTASGKHFYAVDMVYSHNGMMRMAVRVEIYPEGTSDSEVRWGTIQQDMVKFSSDPPNPKDNIVGGLLSNKNARSNGRYISYWTDGRLSYVLILLMGQVQLYVDATDFNTFLTGMPSNNTCFKTLSYNKRQDEHMDPYLMLLCSDYLYEMQVYNIPGNYVVQRVSTNDNFNITDAVVYVDGVKSTLYGIYNASDGVPKLYIRDLSISQGTTGQSTPFFTDTTLSKKHGIGRNLTLGCNEDYEDTLLITMSAGSILQYHIKSKTFKIILERPWLWDPYGVLNFEWVMKRKTGNTLTGTPTLIFAQDKLGVFAKFGDEETWYNVISPNQFSVRGLKVNVMKVLPYSTSLEEPKNHLTVGLSSGEVHILESLDGRTMNFLSCAPSLANNFNQKVVSSTEYDFKQFYTRFWEQNMMHNVPKESVSLLTAFYGDIHISQHDSDAAASFFRVQNEVINNQIVVATLKQFKTTTRQQEGDAIWRVAIVGFETNSQVNNFDHTLILFHNLTDSAGDSSMQKESYRLLFNIPYSSEYYMQWTTTTYTRI